ncbi:uncharacterized protein N7473_011178 [Penicillium subrubescens]|uniref:uncharacterized protein n=1 Tax=Penicillium subrubescens TaxID=1316194 RepID=UPI002545A7A3|nr:uncharacterized protein N7473_011178 [Penicillium subrubescens]KAJ5882744.1 hypothetical protein N7473_011178 [Penicillium subrubescens]
MDSARDNGRSDFEIFNDPDAAPAPERDVHEIEDSIASYIASTTPKDLFPHRPGSAVDFLAAQVTLCTRTDPDGD